MVIKSRLLNVRFSNLYSEENNMFGVFPLCPAYGRDYKSKAEVIAALKSGADFQAASGSYCSLRDFPNQEITVRFAGLTKVATIKAKELK